VKKSVEVFFLLPPFPLFYSFFCFFPPPFPHRSDREFGPRSQNVFFEAPSKFLIPFFLRGRASSSDLGFFESSLSTFRSFSLSPLPPSDEMDLVCPSSYLPPPSPRLEDLLNVVVSASRCNSVPPLFPPHPASGRAVVELEEPPNRPVCAPRWRPFFPLPSGSRPLPPTARAFSVVPHKTFFLLFCFPILMYFGGCIPFWRGPLFRAPYSLSCSVWDAVVFFRPEIPLASRFLPDPTPSLLWFPFFALCNQASYRGKRFSNLVLFPASRQHSLSFHHTNPRSSFVPSPPFFFLRSILFGD